MPADKAAFAARRERASAALRERGIAALLLSPGSDLAYLCGYRIFATERLTCLVITESGDATLVPPKTTHPLLPKVSNTATPVLIANKS